MSGQLYLHYGGDTYTIVGREIDAVQRELDTAMRTGEPHWLEANYGQGRPSAARILVMPGIPLVLRLDTDDAP